MGGVCTCLQLWKLRLIAYCILYRLSVDSSSDLQHGICLSAHVLSISRADRALRRISLSYCYDNSTNFLGLVCRYPLPQDTSVLWPASYSRSSDKSSFHKKLSLGTMDASAYSLPDIDLRGVRHDEKWALLKDVLKPLFHSEKAKDIADVMRARYGFDAK